jgi:hypothetical protein
MNTEKENHIEAEWISDPGTEDQPKKKANYDLLMIVGLLGAWFLLQAWVLPGMGVST